MQQKLSGAIRGAAAAAAASALPINSILKLLLVLILFGHVTVASASFTHLGDTVPSNHTLNDTSLNINNRLCDSSLPSRAATESGNASIPLSGPGTLGGSESAGEQNFMIWSIFTDTTSNNQTFYFTSPRNVLNVTDGSATSISAASSNSSGNSSSCYLDRSAISNETLSRVGSGTVDCASVLGRDCINALTQISASLSNDTLGELQNVSTLVCRVDHETGEELGIAQCRSTASEAGDNGSQPSGNQQSEGTNGLPPSNNIGLILGSVLGGVGLVALILGIIFFFRRRHRVATARRNNEDHPGSPSFSDPFASRERSNAIKLQVKPTAASLGSSGSEAGVPPPSDMSIEEIRPISNPAEVTSQRSSSNLFDRDRNDSGRGRSKKRGGN